jgi:K+-transporting ATPase KdpF subunit
MKAIILIATTQSVGANHPTGYFIGAFIALLILGYLLYSLIRPEKF